MTDTQKSEALLSLLKKSPFSVQHYNTALMLDNVLMSLLVHLSERDAIRIGEEYGQNMTAGAYKEMSEIIFSRVPPFQRDNDKWSRERQSQYVWNLLNGMRASPVCLYNTHAEPPQSECLIHDGLQRTTAISNFFTDPDFYFETEIGRIYRQDYLDIMPRQKISKDIVLHVNVYRFKNHVEACEHYIQINKGISHSEADIKRAEDWMKEQKEKMVLNN